MLKITKQGNKTYSFKIGSELITFPTFNFLSEPNYIGQDGSEISDAETKLLKTISGTKPERTYYDLFPDLSIDQMKKLSTFFEANKVKKTEAMTELSMFPEVKMNHFIKLLELKNVCTKGVFFITTGTSQMLMKGREEGNFTKMGSELISCLDDDDVEFIVMYLNLNLPSSGITSLFKGFVLSHRNSIIIDKKNRKIIRFEPMGAMPKAHENLTLVEIHKKISEYLTAAKDPNLKKHMDYIKKFMYYDTNQFDIYSCPFISAPQLGNIFCQTYSIYGALLYIINSDVFNKTPSSLFVVLGDVNKIMLMWYLAISHVTNIDSPGSKKNSNKSLKANTNITNKRLSKQKTKKNNNANITKTTTSQSFNLNKSNSF